MALSDVLSRYAQGENADTVLSEMKTLMAGASPDDVKALKRALFQPDEKASSERDADIELAMILGTGFPAFRTLHP